MSDVKIVYGNVAVGAKEKFTATSPDESSISDVSLILSGKTKFPNYGNPIETLSVVLDGSVEPIPSSENINIGYWGTHVSMYGESINDNPIVNGEHETVMLVSEEAISSDAITITFDKSGGAYATRIIVKWYNGDALLSEKEFAPNSVVYVCENAVENYNKVVIEIYALVFPGIVPKIKSVEFGSTITFEGDELKNVSLEQKISQISAEIPISTANVTIESSASLNFSKKQPLSIYKNNNLVATMFIENATRTGEHTWQIEAVDYIGVMANVYFNGGMYTNKAAVELAYEICASAGVPTVYFSIALGNPRVSGYLAYMDCRSALAQLAFAIGAVVDTSNSSVVKLYTLDREDISQEVPLIRIMQGQNFADEEQVTEVSVTAHAYTDETDTSLKLLYEASKSGTGAGILIRFSEPMAHLEIVNGTITTQHVNYAIITANSGCVLRGRPYTHSTIVKTRKNENAGSYNNTSVKNIENATLVTAANLDNILDLCYTRYSLNNVTKMKIVDGKHVTGNEYIRYGEMKYGEFVYRQKTPKVVTYDEPTKLGDNIGYSTGYLGEKSGIVESARFNLNGGVVVKEVEVR